MRVSSLTSAPGLVLGAFSFALCVALVPWWLPGPATTPRWALLSVGVPLMLISRPSFEGPKIIIAPGLAFLAYAALSLLWTPYLPAGLLEFWKWCLLAGCFALGASLPSLRPVLIGAGLGMAVNSAIVVAQTFGWTGIPQMNAPAGLFVVKNYVAEPAAMVLVGLLGYRMHWLAAAAVPAALLPMARGASLALGVAAACWLWGRSRALAVILLLGLAGGVGGVVASGAHNDSAGQRLAMWKASMAGLTPAGSGVGSFYYRFPSHAPDWPLLEHRPAHAHSDPLELIYEFGSGALLLFALLAYALAGPLVPERMILIVFLAGGIVGFTLHWPVPAYLAALAAGRLCRDRDGVWCDWHRV